MLTNELVLEAIEDHRRTKGCSPSQRDLARKFVVSATAIHHRLRKMQLAGLVSVQRGSKCGISTDGTVSYTPRQQQVLALLLQGLTHAAAGDILGISSVAVWEHARAIKERNGGTMPQAHAVV